MRTSGRLAVLLQSIVVSTLSGCGGTAEGGQPTTFGSGGADHDGGGSASGGAKSLAGAGGSGGRVQTAGTGGSGAAAGALETGAAGAGGAGAGGVGAGGSGVAGQGAGGGSSYRPSKPTCDDKGLVSFVDGLNLPTAVDFLGVYLSQGSGAAASLYASAGTPCGGATDKSACNATLLSGAPVMGFPQYHVVNATSLLGNYSYMYLAYTRGDGVGFVSDRDQFNAFLGPIDTANEAGLAFLSAGVAPECNGMSESDEAYYYSVHSVGVTCSIMPPGVQFSVTRAGFISSFPLGMATPCVGRRPEGLLDTSLPGDNPLGDYYASIAYLEQAAVIAFDVIERELARFGAPQDLRDRARKARADEVRHATQMAEFARRWGAQVPSADAARSSERSLLDAALENAVEGCVREAWGALSAHYQAATTRDPEAQRAWREIASDESEHAELSFALHEWYLQQLADHERVQVEAAMERARLQLRVELAEAAPPHATVVHGAGVSDPICSVALFNQLEAQLFTA